MITHKILGTDLVLERIPGQELLGIKEQPT